MIDYIKSINYTVRDNNIYEVFILTKDNHKVKRRVFENWKDAHEYWRHLINKVSGNAR